MSADTIILTSLGVFMLVTLLMKTNIALSTFGLGIGYVLSDLATPGILNTLRDWDIISARFPLESTLRIGLIVLPAIILMIRFRREQKGRFFEHIVPAASFALLTGLLVMIGLPLSVQSNLRESSYVFSQFEYFRSAIVIGAAFVAVFDVMIHEKKLEKKKPKKKRKG